MPPKRKTTPAIHLSWEGAPAIPDDSDCPDNDKHTPHPRGFNDHSSWADEMMKTHKQARCPGCNRFAIWVPR